VAVPRPRLSNARRERKTYAGVRADFCVRALLRR
jgi:ribosomal protein L32